MCASCVELVTFDQLRQRYPQLEQHRIAPSGGAFCRAERLKGGGAAGTYAMPRPMAPTGEKHFFGFYLTQRRLLLAEDGEFLRGLADDLEAGTPAQALAELFTRLLQEDMPTLQKYEKRLTALEEDLMQDQAQDLDKKLFRIRRELSVFAAYYVRASARREHASCDSGKLRRLRVPTALRRLCKLQATKTAGLKRKYKKQ